MKKYLSLILSFLLVITSITITPVRADERWDNISLNVEYDVPAGSESEQYRLAFTAPKDGMYVMKLLRDEGSCYFGKSYMNDEEIEPYAEDFRMADNAELFYYQLKKDEKLTIAVGVSPNSLGKVIADTVEELQLGQEMEFTGEFDKSYYYTMPNSFSHVKFACLNPTDSNDNRILNMRVRYFQESSLEERTYMSTPDEYINTALNPIDTKNKPHIFNIYAHKWPQTNGDATVAKSKVKFMRMEEINGQVELNKYSNPTTLIEGKGCTEKTTDNGEKYNKYYYSALSYIKSFNIPFVGKTIEVPANASPTTEQDPYSPYTGYYLKTYDDQDYNHWTVGGDNYFTAKVQYQEFKVPVTLKSSAQLDKLNLYEESSYMLMPNEGTLRYFTFTPEETGTYSLFTCIDNDSYNCDNNIIVTVVDGSNQRPYGAEASKLNNGKIQYESKNMEFEEGKTYTIELYITHKDTNTSANEPVNVTVAMKNPVQIQSVTINRNGVRSLLIDGIDNVYGFYKYSLGDYIDSIDVKYKDSTVCKYTYDEAKKTFVTNADRKYTVYPMVIKDYQSTTPWEAGSNSIDICIGDFTKSFGFGVIDKETFEKDYLQEMKLNQACNLTSLDFVEQKSYYKYYKFVPETNGKYDFEMSTTPHDENCSVSTNYKVYHNGYEVSNNFKAGEEYIVKFYGLHSNDCSNTDMTNINPTIKVVKISSETETETTGSGENGTTPSATTENGGATSGTTGNGGATTGNGGNTPTVTTRSSSTSDVTTGSGTTSNVTTGENKNTESGATTPSVTTGDDQGETTTVQLPTTDAQVPETTSKKNGSETTSSKKQQTTKKINVKAPKATKVKTVKSAKKSLLITWLKVKEVKGYEIQVATDKKFKKNKKTVLVKKTKTVKQKIKKLKAKKKYFVRIRTYKMIGKRKVYSGWSNVKTGKTK